MAQKKSSGRKNIYKKLTRRMQTKLWLVFGAICILFVVLIGRIMYIQYTSGDKYEKIVLAQQDYDSTIIPFQRGDILDCRGTVLATSVDVYNVVLDCKVLNSYEDYKATTLSALENCFDEIDIEAAKDKLRDYPTSQYNVLAKKVSYEEMASFLELKDSELYKGKVYGIWFEKEYIRTYPYGKLAAATIGYASSGNVGVIGLENQYSSVLNGINGRSYGYLNSDSNLEQTTIEPENGDNIVLSIDVNIQSVVEKAILDWNKEYESPDSMGSKHTAAIVMNPNNGQILAMAQFPTFDLENPRDLSAYYTEDEISLMSEEEQLDKLNTIWQNFCTTFTYEPGSTAKPFTVACGLETGCLTGNETYTCDGAEMIKGYPKPIHCVNRNGHGLETIGDALNNSCNDALMQMSYSIGAHNFATYQELFGFGQKTNIDLPGEASTASLIYDEEGLRSTVNLATNSFGQNFNTTMVQMASSFSSLVNGGKLYQPYLMTRTTDSQGNTLVEKAPILQKQTVSPEVSEMIRYYLYDVVANGTAKTAGVEGYAIGGKTGTAEKIPRGTGNYLVSFIGFAPIDNPQVVVYVIVDEPNAVEQYHSTYAQSIAHNIFEQILPYMGIESTLTAEEEAAAAALLTEAALQTEDQQQEGDVPEETAGNGENVDEDNPQ